MQTNNTRTLMLAVTTLVMISIAICGCAGTDDGVSAEKYVVIEEVRRESPTVIAGQMPFVAEGATPEPAYFDHLENNVTVHSPLILYNRYNAHYRGPGRDFVSACGIYSFPDMLDWGLTVTGVDGNGVVHLRYGNESIDLAPGKSWRSPEFASRLEYGSGVAGPYSVRWDTYCWLYNLGLRSQNST